MPERTTHFRSLFRPLFPLFLLSLAVSSRLRFSTDSADTFPPNRSFSPIAISANISLEYESLWLKRGTVLLLPKSNSFFFSHLNERSIHSLLFLFFFFEGRVPRHAKCRRTFFYVCFSFPPSANKDRRVLAARRTSDIESVRFAVDRIPDKRDETNRCRCSSSE